MNLKEAEKRTRLRWSRQATTLLESMPESFQIEEFESFVEENFFIVGSTYLIEFLERKKKWRPTLRDMAVKFFVDASKRMKAKSGLKKSNP